MEEDQIITVNETAEEIAAEEAAFSLAVGDTQPGADEQVGGTEEVQPEVAEEPSADGVQLPDNPAPLQPRLIGGMTEEQITAALARTGNLQSTVDKMAGRMGQLMQQIEALRANPPTTQVQQKALDIKLEKLSSQFPELANLLREDLQGIQGGGNTEALAPAAPSGITQEQLDAMLAERLSQSNARMQEQLEVKVLSAMHPDWQNVIRTQDFALFRDNVVPAGVGQQLMESEDSVFISQKLSEFKAWQQAKEASVETAKSTMARTQAIKTNRLRQAVLPASGASAMTPAPVTEEDAFTLALAAEQKRLNR